MFLPSSGFAKYIWIQRNHFNSIFQADLEYKKKIIIWWETQYIGIL